MIKLEPVPSPRRLLYVGHLPPLQGGAAILCGQLVRALAETGFEITALSFDVDRDVDRPDAETSHPLLTVSRFRESPRPAPDFLVARTAAVTERLPGLAARLRPQAMLVGSESFAPGATDFARRAGIPSAVIVHGLFGYGAHIDCTGTTTRHLLPALRKADRIVSVSEHMAHILREAGLGPVETIPNEIDIETFRPGAPDAALRGRLGLPAGVPVVLHASNLSSVKRPLDLVEAAAIIAAKTRDVRFLVAGDGSFLDEMQRQCARRGVADLFVFTGWVAHRAMPDHYRLADIVAMPSSFEAMPLVYKEAQASGLVLLASDIDAAREAVRDGETGLLHRPGDARHLAQRILSLIDRPRWRAAIGAQARARICAEAAGGGRTLGRYLELIDSLAPAAVA